MRLLPIAYGNSAHAKTWSNKTITFDELCERLKVTIRTPETVEEYPKLNKTDRDLAKDKGGFVGGLLKDNRRKVDTVVSRSMLTLDVDNADVDFIDKFKSLCKYESCYYTTHSHTPSAPRLRVIIPMVRDVSPDEYIAIARHFANDYGIDQFDECSYKVNQLMYWPSTPSNGEYIFEHISGAWFEPDKYLQNHPHWRDCSLLPTSSRESIVRKSVVKKQEDPLEKQGIIGAFCRTYSIADVIEKYLSDVYSPSVIDGRYDYILGEGQAGVIVYDDKFAYSHHATDPASGKLCNAFDLVRVHLFGNADDKESYKQMSEFASNDEKVKLLLLSERNAQIKDDFSNDDDSWKAQLSMDKHGRVHDTLDNIVIIIRNDKNLKGIAYNLHRDSIDVNSDLPWKQTKKGFNDSDFAALKVYLSNNYGIYAPTKTKDALLSVAVERAFHPIRDWFKSLPEWDNIPRVESLYIDYFGAKESNYVKAVAKKTQVAAVARIFEPGKKFDSVTIINGPQGIGKSTFYSKLGGAWYSDSLTITDMKDKAGPEKLQGYWILELSELAGMKKADVETVKSFISRVDDKYRVSYGVLVENHPRQCIIVGSTNAETGFLRDITGNRRFWPISVTGDSKLKPWNMTDYDIKQIWAESYKLYKDGESLFLDGNDAIEAADEQVNAMETDDREGIVRTYLNTPLPENWNDISLYERRNYLYGDELTKSTKGTVVRNAVCNIEIWCECFGKDPSSLKPTDSYTIAAIMKKITDWEKGGRTTFSIYGQQRAYRRKTN